MYRTLSVVVDRIYIYAAFHKRAHYAFVVERRNLLIDGVSVTPHGLHQQRIAMRIGEVGVFEKLDNLALSLSYFDLIRNTVFLKVERRV